MCILYIGKCKTRFDVTLAESRMGINKMELPLLIIQFGASVILRSLNVEQEESETKRQTTGIRVWLKVYL